MFKGCEYFSKAPHKPARIAKFRHHKGRLFGYTHAHKHMLSKNSLGVRSEMDCHLLFPASDHSSYITAIIGNNSSKDISLISF